MKKAITSAVLLIIAASAFSQQSSYSIPQTSKDYFQKSKNQREGAWVLLIGGMAIFAGTALYESHNLDFNSPHRNQGMVPIYISIACAAGSIPLFIAAGKNKLNAIKVTAYIKMEKIPVLQQTGINLNISLN